MTRYELAATILAASTLFTTYLSDCAVAVEAFAPQISRTALSISRKYRTGVPDDSSFRLSGRRCASIAANQGDNDDFSINGSESKNSLNLDALIGAAASLSDVTASTIAAATADDEDDEYEKSVAASAAVQRPRRIVMEKSSSSLSTGKPTFTYDVTLPIAGTVSAPPSSQFQSSNAVPSLDNANRTATTSISSAAEASAADRAIVNSLGISLRQVSQGGVLSEMSLDLDSLKYTDYEEDMMRKSSSLNKYTIKGKDMENEGDYAIGSIQTFTLPNNDDVVLLEENLPYNGIVVSSVVRGGLAWETGVRAGDILVACSATLGDKIWPKSTLDGVRSAISSRKVVSSTMQFQFKRNDAFKASSEVVEEFELSITRPMGINIENSDKGFVQITGFTDQAPLKVRSMLRQGDRVVAVDSSLGNKMWPVSNVEGLVSACTSRLPGQAVKLRFERVVSVEDITSTSTTKESAMNSSTSDSIDSNVVNTATTSAMLTTTTPISVSSDHKLLQSRCRDVLRRYMSVYDANASGKKGVSVPALVADRVLEALADASAPLDAKTLSLVMNSYLSCHQPKDAIRAFEAAVGLAADGSSRNVAHAIISGKKRKGRVVADDAALNLYTATSLLRAHSLLGNCIDARRVLAAMEGDNLTLNGIRSFRWPCQIKVDTKCYNMVLAAATKAGSKEGLDMAVELFDSMAEPVLFMTPRPKKSIVTYNTLISGFARVGRRQDAFTVFNKMKEAGFGPDKFTITSLIKSAVEDNDIRAARNLLRDMKKAGINADVVTYNTVIRALCDRFQWYEAKELVTEMESNGIIPDGKTYGLLMNGLLKSNKPGPCLTLFEAACADQRTVSLTENVQLYTTAITAAATIGDHERALDLISRMTFAGVKPNIKTLTALMGACLSAKKTDYALDVYAKIENPDGYAMTLAVRGYCDGGNFSTAAEILSQQNDGRSKMTGKQIMSGYNYLIKASLERFDYEIAKHAMNDLLKAGYIPSKTTFKLILDSLGLLPNKQKSNKISRTDEASKELQERFEYLLSVIDALNGRKIECDGYFYSAILFEGASIGGLQKKIASLIVKSKSQYKEGKKLSGDSTDEQIEEGNAISWVQFIQNYSRYRNRMGGIRLYPVRVRISGRELRQVLFAEQGVTYGTRRGRVMASRTRQN